MTLTEKILARAAKLDKVKAGDIVWVDVDKAMMDDILGPRIEIAEKMKEMQSTIENAAISSDGSSGSDKDVLFAEAGRFIIEKDKASIGMLQRWFKIGFNRAARIMDQLADAGVVGEEEGTKPRKVLMSSEQFEQYIEEQY